MTPNDSDERMAVELYEAYCNGCGIQVNPDNRAAQHEGYLAEAAYVRTLLAKERERCAEAGADAVVVDDFRIVRQKVRDAILALYAPEVPVWCEHCRWERDMQFRSSTGLPCFVFDNKPVPSNWTRCPICPNAPRPSEVKA